VHDKLPEYYSKCWPSHKTGVHEVCGATNQWGKGPKNMQQDQDEMPPGKKKEIAGTICIQRKDLTSSHFAWAAANYQDVQ